MVGKDKQFDLVPNVVCTECSGQEEQTVEAERLRRRETVAFRRSGRSTGDVPRMDDAIRQCLGLLEGPDQQIIMLRVPWFHGERVRVNSLKSLARLHRHHVLPTGLKPCEPEGGDTRVV